METATLLWWLQLYIYEDTNLRSLLKAMLYQRNTDRKRKLLNIVSTGIYTPCAGWHFTNTTVRTIWFQRWNCDRLCNQLRSTIDVSYCFLPVQLWFNIIYLYLYISQLTDCIICTRYITVMSKTTLKCTFYIKEEWFRCVREHITFMVLS